MQHWIPYDSEYGTGGHYADDSYFYERGYVPPSVARLESGETNPFYDQQTYDPQGYAEMQRVAELRAGSGRGGLFGALDRVGKVFEDNVTQRLEPFVQNVADEIGPAAMKYGVPLAAAAITGGAGAELFPGLMGAFGGGAPVSSGIPSVANAATGAGEIGGFLTGAGAPGFTTSGALTPTFGGATFGAPTTLAGAQAALTAAAGAAPSATSGIAKLAEAMGINKAAEMLGVDPSTLMKLAGGVIAGGATALANRGSGNPAPITQTGFQGQIDPNALKYVGNNQYIKNPVVKAAAGGGIRGLGMQGMAPIEYKAGGKYLSGPGDGMSDNIKANIDGRQEARLADGEFVIPADVVSHIGNGSSNAGAKKLHAMMDRIREARTGNPKQGKQIKAEKFLPA